MAILGLLMAPWARLLERETVVVPRILADDLNLTTIDDDSDVAPDVHLEQHVQATQLTLSFVSDMGGKVSLPKCVVTSSAPA
eukprot:15453120-Alexandrium_andersonii.AAC.1